MAGGKQEDAERREREERLKELMREIRQLRLELEHKPAKDFDDRPAEDE